MAKSYEGGKGVSRIFCYLNVCIFNKLQIDYKYIHLFHEGDKKCQLFRLVTDKALIINALSG